MYSQTVSICFVSKGSPITKEESELLLNLAVAVRYKFTDTIPPLGGIFLRDFLERD